MYSKVSPFSRVQGILATTYGFYSMDRYVEMRRNDGEANDVRVCACVCHALLGMLPIK